MQPRLFALKILFALAHRIGVLSLLHAPIDFLLYESRILQQADDFRPDCVVEILLSNSTVLT